MDVRALVTAKARAAREAAVTLALCPTKTKNDALMQIARARSERRSPRAQRAHTRAGARGARGGGDALLGPHEDQERRAHADSARALEEKTPALIEVNRADLDERG